MRRVARAVLVALATLAVPVAAQASNDAPLISVRIDPPDGGEVGSSLQVTLSIAGDQAPDCHLIETPPQVGGQLTLSQGPSTSQSMMDVNGHITRSLKVEWVFDLVPEKTGQIEVGPFRINCRGQEVRSRTVPVQVRASSLPADTVTLQLRAGTSELWQGQTFSLDVLASIDATAYDQQLVNNGLVLDLPFLAGVPGLLVLEAPEPSQDSRFLVRLEGRQGPIRMSGTRTVVNGKPRYVLSRSFIVLATAPGDLKLPTSRFSATLATRTEEDRSPFALLGGNLRRVVAASTATALAEGPPLHVSAPPAEGRPASWVDAVGHFKFTGTADVTSVKVGETCTLTLTVSGDGNIDFLKWPEFDQLKQDFRIFGKTPHKLARTQVLEIQVSPKSERVTQVPALEFSWFDPETQKYAAQTVGPFPLSVTAGGTEGLATLETPDETLSSLVTVRETLPPPSGDPPSGWLLTLPGAALLAAVEIVVRRRRWRQEHPDEVARRAARRRLSEALQQAADARDLGVAFGKYLSARLGGPPAGLSAEDAAVRLSDGELAGELRAATARWEAASFGGAAFDLASARAEAGRLADRVESAT